MNLVRIYHPKLPGQHADVPESAVAHHSRAGWTPEKPDWAVEQEAAEQAERAKAEAARERAVREQTKRETPETSGVSSLERSPRRRRQNEESE